MQETAAAEQEQQAQRPVPVKNHLFWIRTLGLRRIYTPSSQSFIGNLLKTVCSVVTSRRDTSNTPGRNKQPSSQICHLKWQNEQFRPQSVLTCTQVQCCWGQKCMDQFLWTSNFTLMKQQSIPSCFWKILRVMFITMMKLLCLIDDRLFDSQLTSQFGISLVGIQSCSIVYSWKLIWTQSQSFVPMGHSGDWVPCWR